MLEENWKICCWKRLFIVTEMRKKHNTYVVCTIDIYNTLSCTYVSITTLTSHLRSSSTYDRHCSLFFSVYRKLFSFSFSIPLQTPNLCVFFFFFLSLAYVTFWLKMISIQFHIRSIPWYLLSCIYDFFFVVFCIIWSGLRNVWIFEYMWVQCDLFDIKRKWNPVKIF